MLLKNKVAVIFAAGGSLGNAIAKAMAAAGAKLFLSNDHTETIERLAKEIRSAGGEAEVASVDALNESEVNTYIAAVLSKAGRIDISLNLIKTEDLQGIP